MTHRATSHRVQGSQSLQTLAQAQTLPQARSIAVPWSEYLGSDYLGSEHLNLDAVRANAQNQASQVQARALRSWIWSAFAVLATFVLLAFLWVATAAGQEFESNPVTDKFDYDQVEGVDSDDREIRQAAQKLVRDRRQEYSRVQRLCRDIVEGKTPLAGNEAEFDGFFRDYLFAKMTQLDQKSLQALGEMRDDLFSVYITRGEDQEAYNRLVKTLAFEEMKKIADGNYHPAARVNAMTIIGQLDGVLGQHRDRAPVPLTEALPYMIQHVGNAATPNYLKVAALAGILRHARIDGQRANDSRLPAPVRDQVVSQMVSILNADATDTDPALREWMERQAIRVLGAMRMPGTNNAAAKVVFDRLNGEGSFWLRSDAAEAYGMMKFGGGGDANADEASMKIAELAVEAARYELAYLEGVKDKLADLEKWRASGGQSNVATGGFGGMEGAGDPRSGAPGGDDKGGGAPAGGAGKGGAPGGPPGGGAGKGGGSNAPAGPPDGGRGGRGGRGGAAAALAQGGGAGKGGPGGGAGKGGPGGGDGKGGGSNAPAGPPGGGDDESAGFGGAGFPGGGFGGFATAGTVDAADPNALPNYVSLVSRRRLKTIVGALQAAVGSEDQSSDGMLSNLGLDDATKRNLSNIRDAINKIMSATDAGLDGGLDDQDPNDAYVEALEKAANELETVCNNIQGAGAAEPFGAPAAAEEGDGLPNN